MGDSTLVATEGDITKESDAYRDGGTGLSLYENYAGIQQAIDSGNWIDGAVSGIGLALDAASLAIDPFSTLLSMGISWAIEQIEPLKEALDWLAGNPQTIEVHALTWDNISTELVEIAEALQSSLDGDLEGWQGDAAEAYREMLWVNTDAAGGLAGTAAAMAAATRGAGTLVQMVREFIRDFVADCIAKVVVWILEIKCSAGFAAPAVTAQLAVAVVKWAGRIFGWLMGLITSLQALRALLDV